MSVSPASIPAASIHTAPLHAAPLHAASLLDPTALLEGAGPWVLVVVMAIVFIETGLLFPFLPGDTLVFTAALLAVPLGLTLPVLVIAVAAAAILGDQTGYHIGRRFGGRLFKPEARLFKTKYRDQADDFFTRYGGRALVLARFVPLVRTFVPPIVGMSAMPFRSFLLWNGIGGVAWALLLTLAGYFLGGIPFVANNIEIIAVLIVIVSVLPIVVDVLRRRRKARA
ncbi:alkaline phosphatase [Subtercola boreus]|uniref:Alkaline phosphatase n=1 Tax=Subtercola boreus TaxID=120213 RepID=A0A3E0VDD5_9MICO|nr:VTT domain-containing protein [Subtercola boreus]RFA07924.1 alkaline phosphatase [Subtercola boreus]TQL55214.1 membrane-associated protein [Subtercola boreus]